MEQRNIPVPIRKTNVLIPKGPTNVLIPKSPSKTLIPKSPSKTLLPKSPTKSLLFTPEMIHEDTIINFAMSLSKIDLKGLIDFLIDYYYNDVSLVDDDTFNKIENIYKELYGEYEAEWPKPRGQTVLLPYHLSSLKKMIEVKDINNWVKNHNGPYLLQDKIDGVTLLLVS